MDEQNALQLILQKLDKLDDKLTALESRVAALDERTSRLEARTCAIERCAQQMTEDTAITREAANTLLRWAEKTDNVVHVGLYP